MHLFWSLIGRAFICLDASARNDDVPLSSLVIDFCKGIITRRRRTVKGLEESVIDYLILSEDMFEHMVEMIVDEGRIYSIAKYQKVKMVPK